jgi:molybdate transport system ATP-binding protein
VSTSPDDLALCARVRHGADFTLDVDLRLPGQGVTAVFGPSGCGKTTLLRAVAGLTRPAPGRIVVAGEVWQDDAAGIWRPTHQRPLGVVFQEASLFEHLTVQGNLDFGLKRVPAAQRQVSLPHVVDLLGIGHLLGRRPAQLSGGERQRVAIARALVSQPDCVLADEPTGNLDRSTADAVFALMLELARHQGTAFVLVTHDQSLAARCDRVLHLVQGKLLSI